MAERLSPRWGRAARGGEGARMKLLVADDHDAKRFEEEDLVARAGAALRVRATQDALGARQVELERLVHTDLLTGLFNRRFVDERIAHEAARAQRYRHPLAFAMIDIDH